MNKLILPLIIALLLSLDCQVYARERLLPDVKKELSNAYKKADKLKRSKDIDKSVEAYLELVALAEKHNTEQWKNKAYERLYWIYYGQNDVKKHEEFLLLSLESVRKLQTGEKYQIMKNIWIHKEALTLGYLESNYERQCKLALSYKTHKDGIAVLQKLVNQIEKKEYNIFSGVYPRRVLSGYIPTITRAVWREAMHQDLQGNSLKAIEILEKAQWEYPFGARIDRLEKSYQLKIMNKLALTYSFLGYKEKSMECLKKIIESPFSRYNKKSKNIAEQNLLYFGAKYYGPKDEYLKQALEMYKKSCSYSATGEDQYSKSFLYKMTKLVDPDNAKTDVFKEIITTLEKQGDDFESHYMKRDYAVEKRKNGNTDKLEKEFIDLLTNCRNKGIKRGEPTIYREYATLLEELGRFEDALNIIDKAIEMTRDFKWHLHLPRLLNMKCRFLTKLNDFYGAELVWDEINALLAKHSDWPEVRLLEIKVFRLNFLLAKGDIEAAYKVLNDTKRFIEQSKLNSYQTVFFTDNDWTERFKKAESEKTPISEEKKIIHTDIQPASILTKVILGEKANARFSLINEGTNDVEGMLKLVGSKSSLSEISSENGNWLEVELGVGNKDNESKVILPAKSTTPIILTSEILDDENEKRELTIEWNTEEEQTRLCLWQFQADATPLDTAVVNSNFAWINPFYSLPLYHTIFNRSDFAEVTDLCVEATVPCRVEIYNAETKELLAVDNSANGSFLDKGDTLCIDDNQNGLPEISIDKFATVLLKTFPIEEGSDKKDIILTLKLKIGDNWVSYAQNRIVTEEK